MYMDHWQVFLFVYVRMYTDTMYQKSEIQSNIFVWLLLYLKCICNLLCIPRPKLKVHQSMLLRYHSGLKIYQLTTLCDLAANYPRYIL